jgi:hypothetical protein
MPVSQAGSINTAALTVPDIYVQIQQPPLVLNGLPTNVLGAVGVASWGPVNSPVTLGDLRAAVLAFGNPATASTTWSPACGPPRCRAPTTSAPCG